MSFLAMMKLGNWGSLHLYSIAFLLHLDAVRQILYNNTAHPSGIELTYYLL